MGTTKLTYAVTPSSGFVATSVELTVTAKNNTGETIEFSNQDEIQIEFPADMVTAQNFSARTPTGSGYTAAKSSSGNYFSVQAPFGFTILNDAEMVIVFSQVPLSNSTGEPKIGIREIIGDDSEDTGIPYEIQADEDGVILWVTPQAVGQGQVAMLNWYSSGGTTVVIDGFPNTDGGKKTFPVQGDPPHHAFTEVYVPENEAFRPYTATLFKGNVPVSPNQKQIVYQVSPVLSVESVPSESTPISVIDDVEISWVGQFASSLLLTTPLIPRWRQPNSPNPSSPTPGDQIVSPGRELLDAYSLNRNQIPASAVYVVTANGYEGPKFIPVTFTFEPVTLVYFKFATKEGASSGFESQINPDKDNWAGGWTFKILGPDLAVFTIFQPGSPGTDYYLGSGDTTHPQIQFFNYTEVDGGFELEWITANLKNLGLTLNGESIPQGDIANGTKTVAEPGKYTLIGTAENGLTVNSILEVTPA